MKQQLEPLFTPWKIGNCEIKNRIVLTSMGGTNLLGWMEVNHFDKDGLLSYSNLHYFLLNTFALDCVAKLLPKLNLFCLERL